ncbi:chaperone protein DnaJ-like [Gossypium australe]|uniref:Chaperone protein DnaJ-like n=1 Tax=Gossypium australe TaxID=47621 RepID=A0A5B6W5D5_9ROSI|nr:chaperone protein DnaJ-like [Gossypium australe]
MANSLSFTSVCSFNTCNKPGIIIDNSFPRKVLVAAEKNQSTKPTSIVCADCEGNGAKQCSQCKGTGVNSVDHFNGQFKAGGLCWLCRGKREILCGNCNGAGFIGGFMSTLDD